MPNSGAPGIHDFCKKNLQTGKFTYKDGIIMQEYQYTPETVPDPVVGPGKYMFPVLQYFDGQSKIVYPPEFKTDDLRAKP